MMNITVLFCYYEVIIALRRPMSSLEGVPKPQVAIICDERWSKEKRNRDNVEPSWCTVRNGTDGKEFAPVPLKRLGVQIE
jgi:hypothetical protein